MAGSDIVEVLSLVIVALVVVSYKLWEKWQEAKKEYFRLYEHLAPHRFVGDEIIAWAADGRTIYGRCDECDCYPNAGNHIK